jgi:thermitase
LSRRLTPYLALAVAAALPSTAGADVKRADAGQRFVPGEALVRYEPGTDAAERRELRDAAGVDFEQSLTLARTQLVSFDGSVRAAIERLEDEPGVADAQPNYRYHALAAAPNDTHYGHLWGLGATPGVGVLPAWDRSRGAGQIIAVVDTGVDLTHPDLAPNLWSKPGQPSVHGHDFVDGDSVPDDYNLHGSHVAGTAAAVAGNALGVAGVAPQARIMAVRVLNGDGSGSTLDIADGIAFAANNGAGVINLSLGGPSGAGDALMSDAIAQAGAAGAVVVAAAGNANNNNDFSPTSPCSLGNTNLICVAAVTKTGARSSFSNYGVNSVDLGAPGGDGSGDPDGDVLSAKPSWAAPLFTENFDAGLGSWTASSVSGLDWGIEAGAGIGGSDAATDSPGASYLSNTDSMLEKTAALSLSGSRGCRLDFFLGLAGIQEDVDFVGVGVLTSAGGIGENFTGDTGGFYERVGLSISEADGRTDVQPTALFGSDGAIQGDGAYLDDLNVVCRGQTYPNTIAADDPLAGGSYTAIAGTSMAAPHVSGIAALVRSVDPDAPPSQVVQALKDGARPAPGMSGVTATGGVANAVGAMDAALAIPNPQPFEPGATPPPPTKPKRPRLGKLKVSRKGVVSLVVTGDRQTTGVLTLTANVKKAFAGRVRRVARRSFRIGSRGRATVRLKLSKPALRQLKRKRRLRLKARAVITNAGGLRNARTVSMTASMRRR